MSVVTKTSFTIIAAFAEQVSAVCDSTGRFFARNGDYSKLSKPDALRALVGLTILAIFPLFVGYTYGSSLLSIGYGSPSFLMVLTALFISTLVILVTFMVQLCVIAALIWLYGFVTHLFK